MIRVTGLECIANGDLVGVLSGNVYNWDRGELVYVQRGHKIVPINRESKLSTWVVFIRSRGVPRVDAIGMKGEDAPSLRPGDIPLARLVVGEDGHIYTDWTLREKGVTDLRNVPDFLTEAAKLFDETADPGAVAAFLKEKLTAVSR